MVRPHYPFALRTQKTTRSLFSVSDANCGNGFGCLRAGETDDCVFARSCKYSLKWKCYFDSVYVDMVEVSASGSSFLGLAWVRGFWLTGVGKLIVSLIALFRVISKRSYALEMEAIFL